MEVFVLKCLIFFLIIPTLLFSNQINYKGLYIIGSNFDIIRVKKMIDILEKVKNDQTHSYLQVIKDCGLKGIIIYHKNDGIIGYNVSGHKDIYINMFSKRTDEQLVETIVHETVHLMSHGMNYEDDYEESICKEISKTAIEDFTIWKIINNF